MLQLKVPIQFPVRISSAPEALSNVTVGERSAVNVRVANVSSAVYGGKAGKDKSKGAVAVLVSLTWMVAGGGLKQRRWTANLAPLAPGEERLVTVTVDNGDDAHPFTSGWLQVHLLLNGRSIEYRHKDVRTVAGYDPQVRGADTALLLTGAGMGAEQYQSWRAVLSTLSLRCNVWDEDKQGHLYKLGDVCWLGHHAVIVLPEPLKGPAGASSGPVAKPRAPGQTPNSVLPPRMRQLLHQVLPQHVHQTLQGIGPRQGAGVGLVVAGMAPPDLSLALVDWDKPPVVEAKDLDMDTKYVCCGISGIERVQADAAKMKAQHEMEHPSAAVTATFSSTAERTSAGAITTGNVRLYEAVVPALCHVHCRSFQLPNPSTGMQLPAAVTQLLEGRQGTGGADPAANSVALGGHQGVGLAPTSLPHTSPAALAILAVAAAMPMESKLQFLRRNAAAAASPGHLLRIEGTPGPEAVRPTLLEVVAAGLACDIRVDWLQNHDALPSAELLVAELEKLSSAGGGIWSWPPPGPVPALLMAALLELKKEMGGGIFGRKAKRAKTLSSLVKRMELALRLDAAPKKAPLLPIPLGSIRESLTGLWNVHWQVTKEILPHSVIQGGA
eukprot:jgi/Mesvir1/13554/Mv12443-RA.1